MADDANLLREARERFERAKTAELTNDEEALDDLRFIAGDQWPESVKSEREGDGRPCLTMNRMPQFVRQVTGDIRINKPSIKVHPVDDSADPDTAETYTGLVRHIQSVSDADIAYTSGAQNATACGKGAWRVVSDFEDELSFDQEIRIEAIPNPFAVFWDPDSVKYTREDARYCFVVDNLTRKEFERRYPDAVVDSFDAPDPAFASYIKDWGTKDTVRVAEYFTREPVKKTIGRFQTGEVIDLTDMTEPERAGLAIEVTREVDGWKVESRIISGVEVLEGPFDIPSRFIPIIPIWGEEWHIGDEVIRNGLIRYAKDPQRMYNYHISAATETIALSPKAPFVGTVEQFKGLDRFWNQANTRNFPYLPYNPDGEAPPPQRQRSADVPVAMVSLAGLAIDDMNGTTGLHPPSLGQASNETSGRAIRERKIEGDIGTFAFIDNLARSIRHTGRILVDMIPKIYDGERVIRILGEDDSEELTPINVTVLGEDGQLRLVNDITTGRFDVSISVGPSFSTKRAEASESMIAFMRSVPDAAGVVGDLIAKNQDWPGADEIADRLRRIAVARGVAEPTEDDQPSPPDLDAVLKEREMQMKLIESAAGIRKDQVEVEGKSLDNAQKRLELIQMTGGIQDLVRQEVQRLILQALVGTPASVPTGNGQFPAP